MASPCRGGPLIKSALVAGLSRAVLFFQCRTGSPSKKLVQFHPVWLLSHTSTLQECRAKSFLLELLNQNGVSWRTVNFPGYPNTNQADRRMS